MTEGPKLASGVCNVRLLFAAPPEPGTALVYAVDAAAVINVNSLTRPFRLGRGPMVACFRAEGCWRVAKPEAEALLFETHVEVDGSNMCTSRPASFICPWQALPPLTLACPRKSVLVVVHTTLLLYTVHY